MKFTEKQKIWYNNSNVRINITDGSVRSGKTWGSLIKWIKYIGTAPPGDLIMTGKTDGSLERNCIKPMEMLLGSQLKRKKTEKLLNLWGRNIYTFGANDERAEGKIRGMTCAGSFGDELTLWSQSYFEQLLNRMSVEGAQFFGSTNTDSPYHWLKINYIDRIDDLDLYRLKMLIEDNTFLPLSYINSLKKEKTGLWYKRDILGLWVLAAGAVYEFFTDSEPYVLSSKNLPIAKRKVIGIDYGTNNPCAFGMFGINMYSKPKIWLEKEWGWDSKLKGKQCTDREYAIYLKEFIGNEKISEIIIDPSALSFKNEIIQDKDIKAIVNDADNSVLDGIRNVSTLWKNGDFSICSSCKETQKEAMSYVWDEKYQKKGEDKPKKQYDHYMDYIRYVIQTLFFSGRVDYNKLNKM